MTAAPITDVQIVVPGEVINDLIVEPKNAKHKIVLGPGIRKEGSLKICSKAGLLKSKRSPDAYWIDSVQKRVRYLTDWTIIFGFQT